MCAFIRDAGLHEMSLYSFHLAQISTFIAISVLECYTESFRLSDAGESNPSFALHQLFEKLLKRLNRLVWGGLVDIWVSLNINSVSGDMLKHPR
jgi:hypothetical protein